MCKKIAEKFNESVLKDIKSIKTSAYWLQKAVESREKVSKKLFNGRSSGNEKIFITSFASLSNHKK